MKVLLFYRGSISRQLSLYCYDATLCYRTINYLWNPIHHDMDTRDPAQKLAKNIGESVHFYLSPERICVWELVILDIGRNDCHVKLG